MSSSASAGAVLTAAAASSRAHHTLPRSRRILSLFVPGFVASLYYLIRFRTAVSPRAEVPISGQARWGAGCVISAFTKVKIDGSFRMGRRVQVATGCFLGAGEAGLSIGDDVLVSPNCVILTTTYQTDRLDIPLADRPVLARETRIGDGCWIGANSVILAGSVLGRNVIVSAGSVVGGTVPDNAVVLGNPAKVIFTRR